MRGVNNRVNDFGEPRYGGPADVNKIDYGLGLFGADRYDHHSVDLDQERHRRLLGCRRQLDGTLERRHLLLRRRPGGKDGFRGADRNAGRFERRQIGPQVGIAADLLRLCKVGRFKGKCRPLVDLKDKYLKRAGPVRSWRWFSG